MIFAYLNHLNHPIQSRPHVRLSPHCDLQQNSRGANILLHNNDWQSVTILIFTLRDIKNPILNVHRSGEGGARRFWEALQHSSASSQLAPPTDEDPMKADRL